MTGVQTCALPILCSGVSPEYPRLANAAIRNAGQTLQPPKSSRGDGAPVVGKAYDFALWLLPKVESLPRSFRFTLGEPLTGYRLVVRLAMPLSAKGS